jgi:hypothetical protein
MRRYHLYLKECFPQRILERFEVLLCAANGWDFGYGKGMSNKFIMEVLPNVLRHIKLPYDKIRLYLDSTGGISFCWEVNNKLRIFDVSEEALGYLVQQDTFALQNEIDEDDLPLFELKRVASILECEFVE